ncbi:MAG: 6,7-dimethyl-8-ribityllumazine synthase [Flavobacteriaceae bacterium]|nr:6,7-dimethyl-8-ribityllumazine synthase [Flavobacteriaceae bacterium]|tara:strand:+ start:8354 stop:8830 length:477 start_codon:yes stop_codon:yes gene_type:complete
MSLDKKNLSEYKKSDVPNGKGLKITLVVSEWNIKITERLYHGAFTTLIDNGVDSSNIKRINVPGSFELIYGTRIAQLKEIDVVIAIGSIIKGETKHFDFICQSVSHGIANLNQYGNCPVIFCVLTDNNINQAIERSGGRHGNKGVEAAISALKIARLV